MAQAHNFKDMTGLRLEHWGLTVIAKGPVRQKALFWLCRKDDGTEVLRPGYYLRNYRPAPKRPKKPPAPRKASPYVPEYAAWTSMKQRCLNPRAQAYPDYGGRGIQVHSAWQESYAAFLADVGPRPGPDYSLERKLVDGHYEPGNVVWATRTEQARNKRSSRLLTYQGETLTVAGWAERTGLGQGTIRNRLGMGLPVEEVLRPGRKPLVRANAKNRPQQRHGGTGTPEHIAWKAMVSRCTNERHPAWARYGGRGITVCPEWLASFERFLADMGRRPSPKHSLERERVDEGYGPGNCRWATRTEQARNTSRSRRLTKDGETLCVAAWAERLGVKSETIRGRLRMGWSDERALSFALTGR